MSDPALARLTPDGSRYYTWGEPPETYWSVTTIIGGGYPRWALMPWAAKVVAERAYDDLVEKVGLEHPRRRGARSIRLWASLARDAILTRQAAGELTSIKLAKLTEQDLALRWLKGEPDRIRDAAGAIGSDVHDAAEAHVLDAVARGLALYREEADPLADWPTDIKAHGSTFLRFLKEQRPTILFTETSVFNRTESYAGTLDAGMILPAMVERFKTAPDAVTIVDYKSGASIHPEVALQLTPYSRAEFAAGADGRTEVELPAFANGAVLHIRPTGYSLRPVAIDDEVWAAFLYVREVYRFATEISRRVLGKALDPLPPLEA